MPNERLRAALLERGLTPTALAEELGVDHKTVERWIGGRVPYRRHRYAIATQLGVDEVYLWPGEEPTRAWTRRWHPRSGTLSCSTASYAGQKAPSSGSTGRSCTTRSTAP